MKKAELKKALEQAHKAIQLMQLESEARFGHALIDVEAGDTVTIVTKSGRFLQSVITELQVDRSISGLVDFTLTLHPRPTGN